MHCKLYQQSLKTEHVVGISGFILNRYDRRRVNKLVKLYVGKDIYLETNKGIKHLKFKTIGRVGYYKDDGGIYEVVFEGYRLNFNDFYFYSLMIAKDLWDSLLSISENQFKLKVYRYDIIGLETVDVGTMTLVGL